MLQSSFRVKAHRRTAQEYGSRNVLGDLAVEGGAGEMRRRLSRGDPAPVPLKVTGSKRSCTVALDLSNQSAAVLAAQVREEADLGVVDHARTHLEISE